MFFMLLDQLGQKEEDKKCERKYVWKSMIIEDCGI